MSYVCFLTHFLIISSHFVELAEEAHGYSGKSRNLLPVDYSNKRSVQSKLTNVKLVKLEQVATVLRRKVVALQTQLDNVPVVVVDAEFELIQSILRPGSANEEQELVYLSTNLSMPVPFQEVKIEDQNQPDQHRQVDSLSGSLHFELQVIFIAKSASFMH